MKKILLVLMLLTLIIMPVFAETKWSLGVAGGFPSAGITGAATFDERISLEMLVGANYYSSSKLKNLPVALGVEVYGAYHFPLADFLTLKAGLGISSRITSGYYIAPVALFGIYFPIKSISLTPYIRGDIGYGIGLEDFFWQATAGLSYTI